MGSAIYPCSTLVYKNIINLFINPISFPNPIIK